MEKEYSNEVKGMVYAYRFDSDEKKAIAECLPIAIKKLETKIRRIENNPRNEGQVKYWEQIRILRREKESLQEIVDEFKINN